MLLVWQIVFVIISYFDILWSIFARCAIHADQTQVLVRSQQLVLQWWPRRSLQGIPTRPSRHGTGALSIRRSGLSRQSSLPGGPRVRGGPSYVGPHVGGTGKVHYSDVIMNAMTSQITGVSFTQPFFFGADKRKHQSFASLAFVTGIHR